MMKITRKNFFTKWINFFVNRFGKYFRLDKNLRDVSIISDLRFVYIYKFTGTIEKLYYVIFINKELEMI